MTIYRFDDREAGSFDALTLKPMADTLLLSRSDRVLYTQSPTRGFDRYVLRVTFLGHYT